jgi:hypothetical protein|tara:strand:- start:922 stop:1524 length:603 start_codon:yes stop_codon:yes gene_type:complete
MKKTDKPLTKLTKESLRALIIEIMNEVNPRHSKKDGTFIKKGESGIYSLTKNNKLKSDTESDLEVPARGEVGASGKISSRFGQNSGDEQCGRLDIDGKPKKKKRRCKDYKKGNNYGTKNEEQQQSNGIQSSADMLYIKQLIKQEVEAMMKKTSQTTKSKQSRGKSSKSGCDFRDILRGIQAINTAQDTPLPQPKSKHYKE